MKAAIVKEKNVMVLEDIPVPQINDDTMLIRVKACAICGSDLRIFRKGDSRAKYPVVIGHEIAGIIEKLGANISNFKEGDKVCVAPGHGCGECEMCKKGSPNVCLSPKPSIGYASSGGFAEYIVPPLNVVKLGFVNKIPDNLSFEEASMSELLACCINAQEVANVSSGDTVVIIGAGPAGCIHVELAKARGVRKIILAQRSEARLKMARIFNPDVLINSQNENIVEKVLEETNGVGADVVIIACPSKEMQEISLKIVKPKGRINLFGGLPHQDSKITVDANIIHYKEIYLTGASSSLGRHNKEALELLSNGKINAKKFITYILPLDDIVKGFDLVEKHETIKVVIKP